MDNVTVNSVLGHYSSSEYIYLLVYKCYVLIISNNIVILI